MAFSIFFSKKATYYHQLWCKGGAAMNMIKVPNMKPSVFFHASVAAVAILLLITPIPAIAEDKIVTQETLLDRIQIEDLVIRYYVDLTSGSGHDLAQYYTEDAVLDVNGMISNGREAIQKLYEGVGNGEAANLGGRVHMLLNNPIISVDGDTAKAWVIWTGVMNDDIKKAPRLLEQGREYDELVKRDGRWYIKKRYITADSGLPAMWEDTYKPREHR
jgi:ketosteroid isomerase-like protein